MIRFVDVLDLITTLFVYGFLLWIACLALWMAFRLAVWILSLPFRLIRATINALKGAA
jgi:hypothetical protein